jgi:hypothetical protein
MLTMVGVERWMKGMPETPAHPDLVHSLRSLLKAVRERCALEGRWGWLAAPMAVVTWAWRWRMRREQALALAAFQGMLEQLLVIVEDFRAGKFSAPPIPEVAEAEGAPLRCSASPAVKNLHRGGRRGARRAVDAPGVTPVPLVSSEDVERPRPRLLPLRPARALRERGWPRPRRDARVPVLGLLTRPPAPRARPPPDGAGKNPGGRGRVRVSVLLLHGNILLHPTHRAQSTLTSAQTTGDTP